MIKLNVSQELLDLEGKPIEMSQTDKSPFLFGKAMATILLNHRGGKFDQFKLFELAKRFHNGGEIEFDMSDIEAFKEIVRQDQSYQTAIVTGQIQSIIMQAEKNKEPKNAR